MIVLMNLFCYKKNLKGNLLLCYIDYKNISCSFIISKSNINRENIDLLLQSIYKL
nr:MAG TPA: hypothetical protein [Caudoviricetes sp.]